MGRGRRKVLRIRRAEVERFAASLERAPRRKPKTEDAEVNGDSEGINK